MASRNIVVAVLSILLFLAGPVARCESATVAPTTPVPREEINRSVKEMMSRIPSDLSQYGPNAWLLYFENGPHFLMAADGKLQFDGFDSAKTFLSGFAKNISHVELNWSEVRVEPIDTGGASVAAAYNEVLTDAQGHAVRLRGYFTGVVIQTSLGWKFRTAHWSSSSAAG